MDEKYHTLTISILNRDTVYAKVSELLHMYADKVEVRMGFPIKDINVSVIFLIVKMTNDALGALSGKLGRIKDVKVKSTTLKTD